MVRRGTLTGDVLNAVRKGRASADTIAKFILSDKPNSIRSALARLEDKGLIERTSRGRYVPVEEIGEAHTPSFSSVNGFYLSGLQYNRDVGLTIFGENLDIETAENQLREYAEFNVKNYNPDFYGIASIPYRGEVLEIVNEINL